jgi:hypothetical protein
MPHPLKQKLGTLRGRLRRMVIFHALSCTIGAVLATIIVLGLLDYAIRFQDPGLRVFCSLALLGVIGWVGYRHIYLPAIVRWRDTDLARQLERHFSGLEDRLLSTVEFLAQAEDDPLAGSAALRRAVIAQTTAETERLDFADALDTRPPQRAALTTGAIILVAAILVVLDPSAAQIAVARLMNPFGSARWPQRTHLVIRNPVSRIARGHTFELEVTAAENTKLPSEARIHYRPEATTEGTVAEQVEPMRQSGTCLVTRRENVTQPFSYRVEGGDDQSLPWTAVEVLTPPAIASLAIQLTPPAYTGWPQEKSDKQIRALVGTRIEIAAESNNPLRSATLCLEGGRQVPGSIRGDERHFTVPAPGEPPLWVDKSGSYWFALEDRQGLSGGSEARWEIFAVPDSPPSVTIEEPTANLFVTSRAAVPLRVTAKDDLAIQQIALAFAISRIDSTASPLRPGGGQTAADAENASTEDRSLKPGPIGEGGADPAVNRIPLYTGPPQVGPSPSAGLSATDAGDRQVVHYRWQLEGLSLPPGTQVTFYATATDYLPQTAKSELRRLVVITPEELQQRLSDRQSLVLAELDRVLKMQRTCRGQVQSLEIRFAETGRLEQIDIDHLQAAELNQRQVYRSLTDRDEGVPMHIRAVLADLENNKVDSPELQRRMQALLDEIGRLERRYLVMIGHELTTAVKAAQIRLQAATQGGASDATITVPLAAAGKSQEEVIAALERMLGQLAQWDNYRRFYREVAQLLHDQEATSQQTEEVGRHTLTKALEDLTPQQRTNLKVLSAGELEHSRRLDRILQEMQQAQTDLRQNDPLAAEAIADALAEAQRLGISGQMQSCGSQLAENQIGQAAARQKQIAQDLRDTLDILANRRQHELTRLVKKLQEAEAELERIRRQQAGLHQQLQQQANNQQANSADQAHRTAELQRLGAEAKRLQEQSERLMRQLERLQAARAAQTMQQAAGELGQSADRAGQGDPHGAAQQSQAAAQTLEEVRRQLAARRLQAQAALAMEQMAQLEDNVKHLVGQQQGIHAETARLDGLRHSTGQLTRAQALGVTDLARLQRATEAETAELGNRLAGAGAFALALAGAADRMNEAAALLEQRQTGATTQEAQALTLAKLQLLLEALKPETPLNAPNQGNNEQGRAGEGGAGQGGRPASGVQTLAELKLLKLLQHEINLRTQHLQEAAAAEGKLTDRQRDAYNRLGEEQGRLAVLILELLQTQPEPRKDHPAELPATRSEDKGPSRQPLPKEELP